MLEAESAGTPNMGVFDNMNNAQPFVHSHTMQVG